MTTTSPEGDSLMNLLTLATKINLVIVSVKLILAVCRIVEGPSIDDSVIAMAVLHLLLTGLIATFCVAVDQSIYFDIALVLALIAFLSTIAFARYITNRHQESE